MWRIIDLGGSGYYISSSHNKLILQKERLVVGEIPFSDINSIIVHGEGHTLTNTVFEQCSINGIPITFCDEKHLPAGLFLPTFINQETAVRTGIQFKVSLPRKKQAWKQIVEAKILGQSLVLKDLKYSDESRQLKVYSESVLSGDKSNREGTAAKLYFSVLFGAKFSRDNDDLTENGLLNYAYTIVRSCFARAVSGIGLYPGESVFHSNKKNPFALIDDLMEPVRPIADRCIIKLIKKGNRELNPSTKKEIITLISEPVYFEGKKEELSNAIRLYVMSYYSFISGQSSAISYPLMFKD